MKRKRWGAIVGPGFRKDLTWNDSVRSWDRGRLARTGRRPADQIERTEIAPNGMASQHAEAIGGTPMAATETVALPISIESFRLSRKN